MSHKEYYLSEDVVGAFSCKVYGKTGDKVVMIERFDKVAIVEREGNRFPVVFDTLKEAPVEERIEGNAAEPPVQPSVKAPKSKGKKKTTVQQSRTLF